MSEIDKILDQWRAMIKYGNKALQAGLKAKEASLLYRAYMFEHRLICPECNGKIIKDKEYVCQDCGLVHSKILEDNYNPSADNNESYYQKGLTHNKPLRIERPKKPRKQYANFSMYKSTKDKFEYIIKLHDRTRWKYLSELLRKFMADELFEFDIKDLIEPDGTTVVDMTFDVHAEFKEFCKKRKIPMIQAANIIITKQYLKELKHS